MTTLLFTLSTGEVVSSTDPDDAVTTESDSDTLTLVAQSLATAIDEGLHFMVFPDDRTGKDRVIGLSQIVTVDVKGRESAAVAAVRASEDVSAAQSGVTADVFPLR